MVRWNVFRPAFVMHFISCYYSTTFRENNRVYLLFIAYTVIAGSPMDRPTMRHHTSRQEAAEQRLVRVFVVQRLRVQRRTVIETLTTYFLVSSLFFLQRHPITFLAPWKGGIVHLFSNTQPPEPSLLQKSHSKLYYGTYYLAWEIVHLWSNGLECPQTRTIKPERDEMTLSP